MRHLTLGLLAAAVCAKPVPPLTAAASARPAQSAPRPLAASPTSDVRLGAADEPGEPLFLTGVLSRAEDGAPLPGRTFHIYQADVDGEYDARVPGDDSTGRLSARIVTDAAGRFSIRTIVPGVYGAPPGDPHLHVEVPDAHPPRYDLYFEGRMGASTRRWAGGNPQVRIVALEVREGTLVGHVQLAVRGVTRP